MARPALSVYLLRARDIQSTFTQPLLNRTNEPNSDLDSTVQTDTISKPVNKITIRIKSGDSTIESGTDDERSVIVQEDPLASCIHNHQCLSPSKRSAKALICFLYLVDLAIGIYLAVRSLQNQSEDDYGIIMMSLTAGLLLIGGSVAGICLHTPLGALLCNGDMDANRSLMIFNTSFAFIGVGIYYLVSGCVEHACLSFSLCICLNLHLSWHSFRLGCRYWFRHYSTKAWTKATTPN